MNIYLRQFRISHEEIIQHLTNGESDKIGAEKLRGLLKIIPEADEVRNCNNYLIHKKCKSMSFEAL